MMLKCKIRKYHIICVQARNVLLLACKMLKRHIIKTEIRKITYYWRAKQEHAKILRCNTEMFYY